MTLSICKKNPIKTPSIQIWLSNMITVVVVARLFLMTDCFQVSLDSRVREIINKNMMSPTQRTFDEAQLQIYTLMHRDSYPRFVNSPGYRNLLKTYGGSVRDLTVSQPTWTGGGEAREKYAGVVTGNSVRRKGILCLLYTVTLRFLVNYFVTSSDGAPCSPLVIKIYSFSLPTRMESKWNEIVEIYIYLILKNSWDRWSNLNQSHI